MGPVSVSRKRRMHGCPSHVDEGTIGDVGGGDQSVGLQCGDCSY